MEEVAAPHRNFGVDVAISFSSEKPEPNCMRNPGILYGLGNLIENAVDFAQDRVVFQAGWDPVKVWATIEDDGPGFQLELLKRIGEPFITSRPKAGSGGGLGLGLFIAKTLLERSGASVSFANAVSDDLPGAAVRIEWLRKSLERGVN